MTTARTPGLLDHRRAALILTALVLVAHGVSLFGGFVYDDRFIIVEHEYLDQPSQWSRMFVDGTWAGVGVASGNYRPLAMLTFGVNHVLGDGHPFGFHLVNLLLHVVVVLMVFAVGRHVLRLPVAGALVAAAVFGAHPLTSEPVAEIVGRFDLMAAAAFLGAILCHRAGRARESDGVPGTGPFVRATALFGIGLLSKEHVIVFPAVALAVDLALRVPRLPARFLVYLGYGAVAAGYLGLRTFVFGSVLLPGGISRLDNMLAELPGATRFGSALKVWGLYLLHTVWPSGLAPDYGMAQILPFESPVSPGALVTWAVFLVAAIAAGLAIRRSSRLGIAIAIFVLPFLPVSNLLFPIGTIMGDRLFYLSLAGLALAVGIGWDELRARRASVAVWLAIGCVMVLSVLTIRQDLRWRDDVTLNRYAVTVVPNSARVRNNLGHDYLDSGDLDAAERELRVSISLAPDYYLPAAGLAKVAYRRGDYPEALVRIERARAIRPDEIETFALEGDIRIRRGERDRAASAWNTILDVDPANSSALSNLAILAWGDGEHDEALALWRRAAAAPDAAPGVWLNLGRAYDELGRTVDAVDAYREFLRVAPPSDPNRSSAEARVQPGYSGR